MATASTSWKPGQSGNPSGRPKKLKEFKDRCRDYAGEAIDSIVELCRNPKTPAIVRLNGWQFVAEQAWGKATQPVAGDDEMPPVGAPDLSRLNLNDLREYRRLLATAYDSGSGSGDSTPKSS